MSDRNVADQGSLGVDTGKSAMPFSSSAWRQHHGRFRVDVLLRGHPIFVNHGFLLKAGGHSSEENILRPWSE
jgi:hypothetical protein